MWKGEKQNLQECICLMGIRSVWGGDSQLPKLLEDKNVCIRLVEISVYDHHILPN